VGGVQDGVGNDEPLDGPSVHDVRVDDFVHVFWFNASVPDRFRVDHHCWTQFALIEAAGFVGADIFQAALRQLGFEKALQFALAGGITAWARVAFSALIHAYKNVLVEFGHDLV